MTDGAKLKKGDSVFGTVGWTEYAALDESSLRKLTYVCLLLLFDFLVGVLIIFVSDHQKMRNYSTI